MRFIPVVPDIELAEVLTEQFNGYAAQMEEFGELDPEVTLEFLLSVFNDEDLKYLIEDDYGRALIMGTIHALYSIRIADMVAEEFDEDGDT